MEMEHSHLGVLKMKIRRVFFIFKKQYFTSYLYDEGIGDFRKEILKENCLESLRKRFKWLYEASDEVLLSLVEIKDKKFKVPKNDRRK